MPKKIKLEDSAPVEEKTEDKKESASSEIFEQDGELVVDVFETDADFVVLSPIAGVGIKDIDISLEKDMMVIKGNRQDPHMHPEKKYFFQECHWGPFSKKIILPENINIDKADAQMEKGILTIKIPKTEDTSGGGKIGIKTA